MPRSVRMSYLLLLIGVIPSLGCREEYEEALRDHEQNYKTCNFRGLEKLRDEEDVFVLQRTPETCFELCSRKGVLEVEDASEKGARAPTYTMTAVFNKTGAFRTLDGEPYATCKCLQTTSRSREDTGTECDDDIQMWNLPLDCYARSSDHCLDMTGCYYSRPCCYIEGTAPISEVWLASRIFIKWIFYLIAIAFVLQIITYSIFRVRRVISGRDDDNDNGNDLSENMLGADVSADEYLMMFDQLPTASLSLTASGSACTICLEDLSKGITSDLHRCVQLPNCTHQFHLSCIKTYASHEVIKRRVVSCPNCRVKMHPSDANMPATDSPDHVSIQSDEQPPHPLLAPDSNVVTQV
eukprot:TRINITY_DN10418_c0_g1_i1.p1 TRINITY_DN10418_c0_g1~~TRINITY_DN10418_c0_g1_i1.p1  ORF type:complete len:353 (+),score=49.20 TRINITY_DN10418_c0_g1_i1:40-1098(+)